MPLWNAAEIGEGRIGLTTSDPHRAHTRQGQWWWLIGMAAPLSDYCINTVARNLKSAIPSPSGVALTRRPTRRRDRETPAQPGGIAEPGSLSETEPAPSAKRLVRLRLT
jgi:hypothetical protein